MAAGNLLDFYSFCLVFAGRWAVALANEELLYFLGGVIITLVTVAVMPQNRVVFGVLTLIGSCMLLMQIFDQWLRRLPAALGVMVSFLLFFLTRNINEGWFGFEQWDIIQLPTALYCNLFMTYLGFTQSDFYSTDYFSLFPWAFLFLAGYFFISFLFLRQRECSS